MVPWLAILPSVHHASLRVPAYYRYLGSPRLVSFGKRRGCVLKNCDQINSPSMATTLSMLLLGATSAAAAPPTPSASATMAVELGGGAWKCVDVTATAAAGAAAASASGTFVDSMATTGWGVLRVQTEPAGAGGDGGGGGENGGEG